MTANTIIAFCNYLICTIFGEHKIWRIWRFLPEIAIFSARQIEFFPRIAKLNARQIYWKMAVASLNARQI